MCLGTTSSSPSFLLSCIFLRQIFCIQTASKICFAFSLKTPSSAHINMLAHLRLQSYICTFPSVPLHFKSFQYKKIYFFVCLVETFSQQCLFSSTRLRQMCFDALCFYDRTAIVLEDSAAGRLLLFSVLFDMQRKTKM